MYALKSNTDNFTNLTLSEIVKLNFKTAEVFEKYNLDFCCKGNKQLNTACQETGVDENEVLLELGKIESFSNSTVNYADWELDFLIDYIVNTHHKYILKMNPIISEHTKKIASVHSKNHPELIEIAQSFSVVYKDLKQHMLKEEEMLFPYIKYLVQTKKQGGVKVEPPFFGTVRNPIHMMEAEHKAAGDELFGIRKLSDNYTIPEDACNTFMVTFKELKEFEEDLHKHVHLENYILFPKAIRLEAELNAVG